MFTCYAFKRETRNTLQRGFGFSENMRKPPTLKVEEIPGNQFPDLETAQRASLPAMSESLQAVIQDLLARGVLVNIDGKIIPNPQNCKPKGQPVPR